MCPNNSTTEPLNADTATLSQARLGGFEEDLGLKGNEFNVAVSILNVGYMLMQLPRSVEGPLYLTTASRSIPMLTKPCPTAI